uniref:(California timema) hypothetical protein n=1 Tax=Timema californicum TaxID=61474 RepID=A0A7R9P9M9_TIMCA|nr:unnamed protein product [Timema californicum]
MRTTVKHHVAGTVKRTVPYKDFYGKLRKLDPDTGEPGEEPFQFVVKDDQDYNQRHYEALGEVLNEHVYELLETETNLYKLPVPIDTKAEARTHVFVSVDIFSNTDKLLILVHGSGVVRAGQWARSIIINESLQQGTMLPYIKKARELGYAVLITNTNDNFKFLNGKKINIKGSADPKDHLNYVWKHYVKDVKAKHIAIVAHSYGGFVTVGLSANALVVLSSTAEDGEIEVRISAKDHFSEFKERVFAVAFTDSVHSMSLQRVPKKVIEFLQKVGRNWVAHDEPLDAPVKAPADEITRVSADWKTILVTTFFNTHDRDSNPDPPVIGSLVQHKRDVLDYVATKAGHIQHEMTSWSCMESLFTFLQERYALISGHKEEL